jgi:pyruvate dehydrogenase E2 component (dihydrolipoamide acetyltransferase)
MRRAIGQAMAHSKREIPHYYLWQTIDAEPALAWLEAANARRAVDERLLLAALLVHAVAQALGEFPELNGAWIDDGFHPSEAIHLGFATTLRGGGLVAPAIEDADRLDLDGTMRAIRAAVQRARGGTLTARDLARPTLTITSLGDSGVDGVLPVIVPPQVAIVGFGRVHERVVLDREHGGFRATRALTISLAADHRVSDGHRGARFVQDVERRLLHPGAV